MKTVVSLTSFERKHSNWRETRRVELLNLQNWSRVGNEATAEILRGKANYSCDLHSILCFVTQLALLCLQAICQCESKWHLHLHSVISLIFPCLTPKPSSLYVGVSFRLSSLIWRKSNYFWLIRRRDRDSRDFREILYFASWGTGCHFLRRFGEVSVLEEFVFFCGILRDLFLSFFLQFRRIPFILVSWKLYLRSSLDFRF